MQKSIAKFGCICAATLAALIVFGAISAHRTPTSQKSSPPTDAVSSPASTPKLPVVDQQKRREYELRGKISAFDAAYRRIRLKHGGIPRLLDPGENYFYVESKAADLTVPPGERFGKFYVRNKELLLGQDVIFIVEHRHPTSRNTNYQWAVVKIRN